MTSGSVVHGGARYERPPSDGTGSEPALRPIGIGSAILYFGIPSAVFSASILGVLPWLIRRGSSPFLVFNVTFGLPLALMLAAAIAAYKLEGRPWSWPSFGERMRLGRPDTAGWLWTGALCVFALVGHWLTDWTAPILSRVQLYTAPQEFSTFSRQLFGGGGEFLGIHLAGQWWVLVYFVVLLLGLNIFGEELWWRGYILPRQERANGSLAWIVNGTLWAAFHIFYHTTLFSFVAMLPGTLAVAFVAQRTRNTWPGIVGHTVMNGAIPVMIARGILGAPSS
jgi:membrane protease YdiL (CAAX protease family)